MTFMVTFSVFCVLLKKAAKRYKIIYQISQKMLISDISPDGTLH